MTSLATLALPCLLLASPPADDGGLGVVGDVQSVDEGHFIGTVERVFLDWGAAGRVLRARAKHELSMMPVTPREIFAASNDDDRASTWADAADAAQPAPLYTSPPKAKRRALDSLSNLARVFATGLAKPRPQRAAPPPNFEDRDDDARQFTKHLP